MKIIIATLMREHGTTGVQTHFNGLRSALKARGDEVEIINSFSGSVWLYGPVYAVRPLLLARWFKSISVFWYRYWHYLFLLRALTVRLKQGAVDVINAQCPLSARAAMLARQRAGCDCKVVLTCHFNVSQADEFVVKGDLRGDGLYYHRIQVLERRVLAQADGVVFVSQFSRKIISSLHGISSARSVVIYNGVSESAPIALLSREHFSLPQDAFVMLSVGTLEPRKNQYCLVSALLPILSINSNYFLLLVGDGPERNRIATLVREHKLERQIRLMGFRRDVASLLKLVDLYCHPSVMESFGISVAEAMAAKLAVIAAPVGGIPEFVEHLVNGILVHCEPGDSEFANWLVQLAEDSALRNRLALAALMRYRESLTVDVMGDAYRNYYCALLETAHA